LLKQRAVLFSFPGKDNEAEPAVGGDEDLKKSGGGLKEGRVMNICLEGNSGPRKLGREEFGKFLTDKFLKPGQIGSGTANDGPRARIKQVSMKPG